jgi:hypothetical protein
MLENQFIQFSEAIDPLKNEIAVPTKNGVSTYFFVDDTITGISSIDIVTPGGTLVKENAVFGRDGLADFSNISMLAPTECYRIRLKRDIGPYMYSNLLCREQDDAQLALVKYSCKEPAFGFPFGVAKIVQQLMPINLLSPQFKQEDKVYTKRNGEQVVLFANITKEYDGETDYIPMEWHEKILIALSCDEVYINGERVTKSANYEIDHENYTYTDCGIKLMRATFKVTTNVTQRNSNY